MMEKLYNALLHITPLVLTVTTVKYTFQVIHKCCFSVTYNLEISLEVGPKSIIHICQKIVRLIHKNPFFLFIPFEKRKIFPQILVRQHFFFVGQCYYNVTLCNRSSTSSAYLMAAPSLPPMLMTPHKATGTWVSGGR